MSTNPDPELVPILRQDKRFGGIMYSAGQECPARHPRTLRMLRSARVITCPDHLIFKSKQNAAASAKTSLAEAVTPSAPLVDESPREHSEEQLAALIALRDVDVPNYRALKSAIAKAGGTAVGDQPALEALRLELLAKEGIELLDDEDNDGE